MFKHLLVPLDGSRLAEAPLAAALSLARAMGAGVTLLHTVEKSAPREIHGERHLTGQREARDYLREVAARVFPPEIQVEMHVHGDEVKDVARSIAEHAAELRADLIVMCTHGRGGLRGFMFGRIAQQVSGLATAPVLLIHPSAEGAPAVFSCKRMLVPLDGNPDHEEGLRVAADLARLCGAELYLVMAVHTFTTLSGEKAATAKMLPRTTHALLDLAVLEAEKYLSMRLGSLQAEGLSAAAGVRRGDPVSVIVGAMETTGADLIVLATHGKTGLDAFWSGSTTPNLTTRAAVPLLLVPVWKKRMSESL
ncbi:MAG: universal stress protein [Syntrophobacteraceae bacterium]|nr:universal stress protein [Syntrophobacteraceae bacterium]